MGVNVNVLQANCDTIVVVVVVVVSSKILEESGQK